MDAVVPGPKPIQNNLDQLLAFFDKKGELVAKLVAFVAIIFFAGLSVIGIPLLLVYSQEIKVELGSIWSDLNITENLETKQMVDDIVEHSNTPLELRPTPKKRPTIEEINSDLEDIERMLAELT